MSLRGSSIAATKQSKYNHFPGLLRRSKAASRNDVCEFGVILVGVAIRSMLEFQFNKK